MAESPSPYKPTKRGGGGPLKLLWWQGPTLLNPHFATGTKDQDGSRLFYEPLASWDPDGNMKLVLAAEIPSIQNGGLAADAKSVTWKLKPGVKWHDGKPFTADDVVFNWEYAKDPATVRADHRDLPRYHGREGRRPHRPHPVRQADAVLGRRLCRGLWLPSCPNICSPTSRAPSPARRRTTSRRSAPAPTSSSSSSRAT